MRSRKVAPVIPGNSTQGTLYEGKPLGVWAINAISDKPSGIWHFGFLVPSHEPIQAITKVYQGESAPGRHAENYILDPQGNRIDVVLDMWPTE